MGSKAGLVSALFELTSRREEKVDETNKYKMPGARTPYPGPGESGETLPEVSLKLRGNYVFTHPHEASSLRKKTIPWLCKVFQGRENIKHPKV